MTAHDKSLSEITRDAIEVLSKEIGISNTIRFLNQFTTGHGNYTEERENMFAHMTLDDIVGEIKNMRKQSKV